MFTIDENTLFCVGPGSEIGTCNYVDYGGIYTIIPYSTESNICGPKNISSDYRVYPSCIEWNQWGAQKIINIITPSEWTFEVWVKYKSLSNDLSAPLFDINDGNNVFGIKWDNNNIDRRLFIQYNGTLYIYDVDLELDTWYHLAFQRHYDVVFIYRMYINGVLVYLDADSIDHDIPSTTNAYIGQWNPSYSLWKTLSLNDAYTDKMAFHNIARYTSNFSVNDKLRYQQLL